MGVDQAVTWPPDWKLSTPHPYIVTITVTTFRVKPHQRGLSDERYTSL